MNSTSTVRTDNHATTSATTTPPASGQRTPIQAKLRAASYEEGAALLRPEGPASANAAPVQRQDSVDDQVPEQVDLNRLSVSFMLPAGKTLAGDWTHDVRTTANTRVSVHVDRGGIRVSASPGIFIDAQWPAQNMRFYDAGRNFAQARTYANVSLVRGMGEGFIDLTGRAANVFKGLVDTAISGTAAGERGYDPFADDQILQTLNAIKTNFENLPDAAGDGEGVGAGDVSRPSVAANLTMRSDFRQEQDGVGVLIPAGGSFDFSVSGDGNLEALAGAGGAGEAMEAVTINSIDLRSEAVQLIKDGDPIARLEHVRVNRGGSVSLQRFTLLGDGQAAAGIETLARLIFGMARYGAQGAPPELGARITVARGEANPDIVEGMSRQMIEEGLTTAVRQLVVDNRGAIPGADLAQALGIE